MTDEQLREHRRQFLLTHAYHPAKDFPKEFAEIEKLLKAAHAIITYDDLRYELGEIVYGYRNRMQKPDYPSMLARCDLQLGQTADSLDRIVDDLCKVDLMHANLLMEVVALLPFDKHALIGFQEELRELALASTRLRRLKIGLQIATANERRRPGRARPKLPYVAPTLELVELWQKLTAAKVVWPRGKHEDVAIQRSTEFIRLGLQMIDPKVTVSNAITSIKNALKLNREQVVSESELSSDELHALRLLRKINKSS
jgi:hypothetical protein